MTKLVRCEVISEDEYRWNNVNYGPYRFNILAEGDSWFSVNGRRANNLLLALSAPGTSMVVNFSRPGDLIKEIAQVSKKKNYLRNVALDSKDVYWDALLLSGGGNDIMANRKSIIRKPSSTESVTEPESWVNTRALDATLSRVVDSFSEFASIREGTAHQDLPILIHTYDYATPRNVSRSFFGIRLGPWLHPIFRDLNTPMGMRPIVSDHIFNRLANVLLDLQYGTTGTPIPNFYVCDTRGVLTPASSNASHGSVDWYDEIHPTKKGYEKLAGERMNAELDVVLRKSPRA